MPFIRRKGHTENDVGTADSLEELREGERSRVRPLGFPGHQGKSQSTRGPWVPHSGENSPALKPGTLLQEAQKAAWRESPWECPPPIFFWSPNSKLWWEQKAAAGAWRERLELAPGAPRGTVLLSSTALSRRHRPAPGPHFAQTPRPVAPPRPRRTEREAQTTDSQAEGQRRTYNEHDLSV